MELERRRPGRLQLDGACLRPRRALARKRRLRLTHSHLMLRSSPGPTSDGGECCSAIGRTPSAVRRIELGRPELEVPVPAALDALGCFKNSAAVLPSFEVASSSTTFWNCAIAGLALARPGEKEPEVVVDDLARRILLAERAEPGERRGQVVLVEEPDRCGHLRVDALRMELHRSRIERLGRDLVAPLLQLRAARAAGQSRSG